MNDMSTEEKLLLPALPATVLPAISQLIESLNIPREVLASDEEIQHVWKSLPGKLQKIPESLRNESMVKMCVAVSAGLFDVAINYIWNATILHLRDKVRNFGLNVVAQILRKDFEEKDLLEYSDNRLLDLCLKLNIIDEYRFFHLDQCRNIRNNLSAAHPALGKIDDEECMFFLSRCVIHALADTSSPKGVNINDFISTVKGARFDKNQCDTLVQALTETHSPQRQMLVTMMYGIYCDPGTPEQARLNSLDLCKGLPKGLSSDMRSELLDNHYAKKGHEQKYAASKLFFEKLGLLKILNEDDRHAVFSGAVKGLWNVHNEMNNFYNEPAFAERLYELTLQGKVPETVQEEYVRVVGCCRVGNGYGISNAAEGYYNQMIRNFSPGEIEILIKSSVSRDNVLKKRIDAGSPYRTNFRDLLKLIDAGSVPNVVEASYKKLLNNTDNKTPHEG